MKLIRSFGYAFRGIAYGTRGRNMRIHLVMSVLVIALAVFFSVSLTEWAILLLCMAIVLTAELFNTAIEEVGNIIVKLNREAYDPMGVPKDVAAGAVLVSAILAAVVGLIIFVPHILKMFGV